MLTRRTFFCAVAACAASGSTWAQAYPSKPIRIVVGFAPGGPADVIGRLIGHGMSSVLGHGFVIDNRPGAGGTIGARAVAESDPDGYTLLLGNTSTLILGPLIHKNASYDAVKSFAPVALLGTTSNLLIVNPALSAHSARELVALARARSGQLNHSSTGVGIPPHLIAEMFKQRLGLDVVHFPEAGVPDFTSLSFTGIVAPAGTPTAIVTKLNSAVNESLRSSEVAVTLAKLSVDSNSKITSPQEFAHFLAKERDKWAAVIKNAGVQVE